MITGRSYQFKSAITRRPGMSVSQGLREGAGVNPSAELFMQQHTAYVAALTSAGVQVDELSPLEEFPDSVFVEDSALCLKDAAIILSPGAPSRFGEASAMRPTGFTHYIQHKKAHLAGVF